MTDLSNEVSAVPVAAPGYWVGEANGAVYHFGTAAALPSPVAGVHLAKPIVGMAPTPNGGGYWLVAADGGLFTAGNAGFHGSLGNAHLSAPIVGMAATPDGGGYWMVGSDGGVFTFGNAGFHGSLGNVHLAAPIVAIVAAPGGGGYWLVAQDGGVFSFGRPVSTVRWATSPSVRQSWAWPPPAQVGTGWWPPTAAFTTSAPLPP